VHCHEFLNADFIADGSAPFAPETQDVRRGRLILELTFMHDQRQNGSAGKAMSISRSWKSDRALSASRAGSCAILETSEGRATERCHRGAKGTARRIRRGIRESRGTPRSRHGKLGVDPGPLVVGFRCRLGDEVEALQCQTEEPQALASITFTGLDHAEVGGQRRGELLVIRIAW
jgi:hypothetical protein